MKNIYRLTQDGPLILYDLIDSAPVYITVMLWNKCDIYANKQNRNCTGAWHFYFNYQANFWREHIILD